MSIKISELPSASSVTSSDAIPIVQSGTTKKATVGTILPVIATSITSSSTNDEVAGAKAVYDNSLDVYSTTEQVVGTWINGKPLYEKTIETTVPTVTTDGTETQANIDILGSDMAFILNGFVKYVGSAKTFWTMPYYNNSNRYVKSFATLVGQTNAYRCVIASNGTAYNNSTAYLVVRYTKTADTATRGGEQLKSMNTGSLVGMGDRAEVTLEKEEKPEEITETKSAEVDKLESEEGSGDSR